MSRRICLGLMIIVPYLAYGQLFFQIEKLNSPETTKFGIGSELIFKSYDYSKEWQRGVIKEIDYESQSVVFDHTFLTVDQIDKIKIQNRAGEALGWALKGFGVAWLFYGALIDVFDLSSSGDKFFDRTNITVGAVAIGTGFFIDKLGGNEIYTNNKTHRFRVLDLRFSVDEEKQ